jgi:6-phosphogluconolactonase (cycloisomerase 2 family)
MSFLAQFTLDSNGGMAPSAVALSGKNPCGLAVSPDGAHVFVICHPDESIVIYAADHVAHTLAQVGTPAALDGDPSAIAMDPTGSFLYLATRDGSTLATIAVDAKANLSVVSFPVPTGAVPTSVVLDAAGRYVFTANSGSDTVGVFPIDDTGHAGAEGPVALTPDRPAGTRAVVTVK